MDRIISRETATGGPEQQWGSSRLATVILLGVCNLICYADRVNIGVAILPMKAELGMDKSTEAMVLSSFFWGYVQQRGDGACMWSQCANMRIFMQSRRVRIVATSLLLVHPPRHAHTCTQHSPTHQSLLPLNPHQVHHHTELCGLTVSHVRSFCCAHRGGACVVVHDNCHTSCCPPLHHGSHCHASGHGTGRGFVAACDSSGVCRPTSIHAVRVASTDCMFRSCGRHVLI